jgi:hypothetical protein
MLSELMLICFHEFSKQNTVLYAFLVSSYMIRTTGIYIVFISCQVIHLIDMTDLFKISNLFLGGEAIVTNLCSSLERQREGVVGR